MLVDVPATYQFWVIIFGVGPCLLEWSSRGFDTNFDVVPPTTFWRGSPHYFWCDSFGNFEVVLYFWRDSCVIFGVVLVLFLEWFFWIIGMVLLIYWVRFSCWFSVVLVLIFCYFWRGSSAIFGVVFCYFLLFFYVLIFDMVLLIWFFIECGFPADLVWFSCWFFCYFWRGSSANFDTVFLLFSVIFWCVIFGMVLLI